MLLALKKKFHWKNYLHWKTVYIEKLFVLKKLLSLKNYFNWKTTFIEIFFHIQNVAFKIFFDTWWKLMY